MTDWTWVLIMILAAAGFGLLAAQAWRAESQKRGSDAWDRLVRHRVPSGRPKTGNDE